AKNRHTGRKLFVEAKGGTSSKETTKRFGKPFTPNQAKSHVSVALYCAASLHRTAVAEQADVALAFPDDRDHRNLIQNISKALKDRRVAVYFVDQTRKVNLFQDLGAQARAPADGLPAAFGFRG